MKLSRRSFSHITASTAGLSFISRFAWAESYPARPVRLIVGAVPGSAPDVIARLVAQRLSERLGQAFVVENRNGASGNLGSARPTGRLHTAPRQRIECNQRDALR